MKSISDIIKTELTECHKSITANQIAAGQIASGMTSRMWSVENCSIAGGQLWGFGFYRVWETGRKAGKWPPRAAILSWVQQKLGKTGSEANSLAFLIARKIGTEGSSLYRKGGRKDIFTPPFEKLGDNLADKIGNLLIETIVQKIK
jgi:hypothetical protein